jgi:Na+/H+ antiporter NhaB
VAIFCRGDTNMAPQFRFSVDGRDGHAGRRPKHQTEPRALSRELARLQIFMLTLAGNFTLVGSVANLIVAQRAQAQGVTLGFWEYFKVGAPVTVLTIVMRAWWL